MPESQKKRALASYDDDAVLEDRPGRTLSRRGGAAGGLDQKRTMSDNQSNSSEDLYNVPVGSFADDSPSRRSPNPYDATDFMPPEYYPGQPFPGDTASHQYDAASRGIPHMPYGSGFGPPPGFNPYSSPPPPPAYYPYPPRNSYAAASMPPAHPYHNISPMYIPPRGPSFRPPAQRYPTMFSNPRMRPPPHKPDWAAAKRQRERSPSPNEPTIRTSPISSPRLRKMGFADDMAHVAPFPPSRGLADPASIHRVTMGGPRTTQSLQNINRMMRHDEPLIGTGGKENPTFECNCKKSKCVKLYCECFAAGRLCRGCNCQNCLNTEEHGMERIKAIEHVQNRNKGAFDGRPLPTTCNCRRSACLKKYCECFQGGILCGDKCKCTGCANHAGSQRLIDKRRKMKDHKGAKYAMDMAHQVWRKPADSCLAAPVSRHEPKLPFKVPPSAAQIRSQGAPFSSTPGSHLAIPLDDMDTLRSFEFPREQLQRSSASSPSDEAAPPAPPANRDTLQHGFFGESRPTPSRQTALKIMEFLSDNDKRSAMCVCKAWASLLTVSSNQ